MAPKNLLSKNAVVGKMYQIVKKIGEGAFGEIYEGIDFNTRESVAIKAESLNATKPLLSNERDVYHLLKGGRGFPTVKYYGNEKNCKILVMKLLGPSLEDLLQYCYRFSLKTITMIADQLIDRLHYMHRKSFLHLDIKPANLLVGVDEDDPLIYVVDMGIAKNYIDTRTKIHVPLRKHESLPGTAKYSSLNTDKGMEQSRRDDMESLGYVLIYFWKGKLPWEGLKARNKEQRIEKIIELKLSTSVKELCEGMPEEFVIYMNYCRSLGFTDEPDYMDLRNLFRELFENEGFQNDEDFDWDT